MIMLFSGVGIHTTGSAWSYSKVISTSSVWPILIVDRVGSEYLAVHRFIHNLGSFVLPLLKDCGTSDYKFAEAMSLNSLHVQFTFV